MVPLRLIPRIIVRRLLIWLVPRVGFDRLQCQRGRSLRLRLIPWIIACAGNCRSGSCGGWLPRGLSSGSSGRNGRSGCNRSSRSGPRINTITDVRNRNMLLVMLFGRRRSSGLVRCEPVCRLR